jgi:hypothetical protein
MDLEPLTSLEQAQKRLETVSKLLDRRQATDIDRQQEYAATLKRTVQEAIAFLAPRTRTGLREDQQKATVLLEFANALLRRI